MGESTGSSDKDGLTTAVCEENGCDSGGVSANAVCEEDGSGAGDVLMTCGSMTIVAVSAFGVAVGVDAGAGRDQRSLRFLWPFTICFAFDILPRELNRFEYLCKGPVCHHNSP